jgi:hypothetical protein
MSADPRSTHFVNFARLLREELFDVWGVYIESSNANWHEEMEEIISRRAYDLVIHTLTNLNGLSWRKTGETEEIYRAYLQETLQDDVPDMTELPEVEP